MLSDHQLKTGVMSWEKQVNSPQVLPASWKSSANLQVDTNEKKTLILSLCVSRRNAVRSGFWRLVVFFAGMKVGFVWLF